MEPNQPGKNGRRSPTAGGMVIALTSVKGSPAVTTTAVGLASRWPDPGAVVMEADPAGGDLAARFGHHFEPGLATMALDSRRTSGTLDPQAWLQALPCGVEALLAAPGASAAASLAELAGRLPQLIAALAVDRPAVLIDTGRWQQDAATGGLLSTADVVLIMANPAIEGIRQLQVRMEALRALNRDVRLVLVGEDRWSPREISTTLGLPVAGNLPIDPRGAGVLSGRLEPRKGWQSAAWTGLPLIRAYRSLAARLASSPQQAAVPVMRLAGPTRRLAQRREPS